MARESDIVFETVAGPEIGVASTKAFTAQLTVLACLAMGAARARGADRCGDGGRLVGALLELPSRATEVLAREEQIRKLAERMSAARDVLCLGRGANHAIALEAALKLKEICYIHAEGYAAGEMKHGPIALIDRQVPILALLPSGPLFEKTASNVQEAGARGGQIVVLSDAAAAPRCAASRPRCSNCRRSTRSRRQSSMRSPCRCWPITPRFCAGPTWTSRAIWQRALPSSNPHGWRVTETFLTTAARQLIFLPTRRT